MEAVNLSDAESHALEQARIYGEQQNVIRRRQEEEEQDSLYLPQIAPIADDYLSPFSSYSSPLSYSGFDDESDDDDFFAD